MDMINHDRHAGGFIELQPSSSKSGSGSGSTTNEEESKAGTFVVRSVRHGRHFPLQQGQELLVNYNVPHY